MFMLVYIHQLQKPAEEASTEVQALAENDEGTLSNENVNKILITIFIIQSKQMIYNLIQREIMNLSVTKLLLESRKKFQVTNERLAF